jgi:prepilin-type N-terminal cleavage/methylation domain-containing protein
VTRCRTCEAYVPAPRLAPETLMIPWRHQRGHTLIEVLAVVSVLAVVVAAGLAWGGAGMARHRVDAAARRVASWYSRARVEAGRRGRSVGVRFDEDHGHVRLRLFADGAGDGVRPSDIEAGLDPPVGPAWCLQDDYPGVTYSIGERLPEIDGSGWLEPGSEAIRVGSNRVLAFTPYGTASGGTVYLRGKDGAAYAVRVLGATSRTRVLHFDRGSRLWTLR